MTFCALLSLLALTALLLTLLPWLLDRVLGRFLERFIEPFCRLRRRLWIALAFLAGLVFGALLYRCGAELREWLFADVCRQQLITGFALLLPVLVLWVFWVGRCGVPRLTDRLSWAWILALLALALWLTVLWCCRDAVEAGPGLSALCSRLLTALVLLAIPIAAMSYLTERHCRDRGGRGCQTWPRVLTWLAAALLVGLIGLVRNCCDELVDREHELAMVGIWWGQGGYEGEVGAHLRWGFSYGLEFPDGGFDLERRESGSGAAWTALNGDRIRPALVWGDEAAPSADMWRGEAVARIHPDSWDQFRGTPFDDLVAMVQRDPYLDLYFVETPDPAEFVTPPANPYDNKAQRDAYLASYYAAGTEEEPMRPLAVWTWEPMTAISTTALFPEIARLVGLYYLDRTAEPGVEYDYRVVGYWPDRTRSYVVERLSEPRTEPLLPPSITRADSPVTVGEIAGVTLVDDRAAALTWTPPSADPDELFGPLDKIDSVVFYVEHKDLEGSGSPPVCPAATDGAGFAPARRPAEDGPALEDLPPVTVSPLEDEATGELSWPEHYFFHRDVVYGCHAYRVEGRDLFGRPSPTSSPRVVAVHDLTAPPPPFFVRASFYQRLDEDLPQAVRDAYLPDGGGNAFALVVSWVWTDDMAERVDDLKEFRVHLRHTGYETFVKVDGPDTWRDAAVWDRQLGGPRAFADTDPMPARLSGLPQPVVGRYYEAVFTDADFSAADVGLAAGDLEPVEYAWMGVSGTDHDPYNNPGGVSAPVLVFGRDLTPPEPPEPPPALVGLPSPADDSGDRALRLGWPGNALYDYRLHRVDVALLGAIGGGFEDADLPPCLVADRPSCDPAADGEACVEEHEEFDIRATAALEPGVFTRVSPLPIEVSGAGAEFVDSVDATSSRRLLYAAAAVDAAGNASALSCPSVVILVEDGVAPHRPVWSRTVGGDGRVVLTWSVNPEPDLDEYTVYRAVVEENTASRRKMIERLRLRADGTAVSGGPDATVTSSGAYDTVTWADDEAEPGRLYYYRLDAVDLAGNHSQLSGVASARAFDAAPPAPPVWASPALTAGTDGTGHPQVTLAWQIDPADPEVRIQVQRRRDGTRAWRSQAGWLDPGTPTFVDDRVRAGGAYTYRLRAMDPAGNRSEGFSPVESIVAPP